MPSRLAFLVALAALLVGSNLRADDADTTTPTEPQPQPTDAKPSEAEEPSSEPTRRSAAHEEYAKSLWQFLHRDSNPYEDWDLVDQVPIWPIGPVAVDQRTYRNSRAALDPNLYGAVFVTEHLADAKRGEVTGITVRYRVKEGYDPASSDWYWAHYLLDGAVAKTSVDKAEFDRPGYLTRVEDGRLWIVGIDDPALAEFVAGNPPEEHVTRDGGGPNGMTVEATSDDAITLYMATKPSFVVRLEDGDLWVFRSGSREVYAYDHGTPPEKPVTREGSGPGGATIKAVDEKTLDAYEVAATGFDTALVENRIWVFRPGSEASRAFLKSGEPAEKVTRTDVGPGGRTVHSVDRETIDAYLAALGIESE